MNENLRLTDLWALSCGGRLKGFRVSIRHTGNESGALVQELHQIFRKEDVQGPIQSDSKLLLPLGKFEKIERPPKPPSKKSREVNTTNAGDGFWLGRYVMDTSVLTPTGRPSWWTYGKRVHNTRRRRQAQRPHQVRRPARNFHRRRVRRIGFLESNKRGQSNGLTPNFPIAFGRKDFLPAPNAFGWLGAPRFA